MVCEKCNSPMIKAATGLPVYLPEENQGQDGLMIATYICSECGHADLKAEERDISLLKKHLVNQQ